MAHYEGEERRAFRFSDKELDRLKGMIQESIRDEIQHAFGLFGLNPTDTEARNAWIADRAWVARKRLEDERGHLELKKAAYPVGLAALGAALYKGAAVLLGAVAK